VVEFERPTSNHVTLKALVFLPLLQVLGFFRILDQINGLGIVSVPNNSADTI
jgi:hypothetical protein